MTLYETPRIYYKPSEINLNDNYPWIFLDFVLDDEPRITHTNHVSTHDINILRLRYVPIKYRKDGRYYYIYVLEECENIVKGMIDKIC